MLAAHRWTDNGEMMIEVAQLWLDREMKSMDVTYGEGIWWKHWKPRRLVKHDMEKLDGVDFRHLPHRSNSFELVAYDPPYVAPGGRKTSTIKKFNKQYGLETIPKSPALAQAYIDDGLTEVHRVLRSGGIALVKCMNYVSSGKLWLGYKHTMDHALSLGFEVLDIFYFVGDARPQPEYDKCKVCRGIGWVEWWMYHDSLYDVETVRNWVPCERCGQTGLILRQQVHARTNVSFLFVLRK